MLKAILSAPQFREWFANPDEPTQERLEASITATSGHVVVHAAGYPDDPRPEVHQRLSREVVYVERSQRGGEPTDHIAGSIRDVDFQMWIGDDTLLRRIVLTYPNAPGEPQLRADFSDWDFAPPASETIFTFYPPEDAERIPTLLPVSREASGDETEEDES